MKQESEYIPRWEPLVEALRKELEEQGELLALINDQQAAILGRDTQGLGEAQIAIEKQMKLVNDLRGMRERQVDSLLQEWAIEREFKSLKEIIPLFPEASHALLNALVNEINEMIDRTRRRARQNQMLLARATSLIEQVISTIQPQSVKTYNRRGAAAMKVPVSLGNCFKTSV